MSPVPEHRRDGPGWIRHSQWTEAPALHICQPPVEPRSYHVHPTSPWPSHLGPPSDARDADAPAGAEGDLWRCGCGRLWQVHSKYCDYVPGGKYWPLRWRRAPLLVRWCYGNAPVVAPAKPQPPRGPSGVSPGPDGSR